MSTDKADIKKSIAAAYAEDFEKSCAAMERTAWQKKGAQEGIIASAKQLAAIMAWCKKSHADGDYNDAELRAIGVTMTRAQAALQQLAEQQERERNEAIGACKAYDTLIQKAQKDLERQAAQEAQVAEAVAEIAGKKEPRDGPPRSLKTQRQAEDAADAAAKAPAAKKRVAKKRAAPAKKRATATSRRTR